MEKDQNFSKIGVEKGSVGTNLGFKFLMPHHSQNDKGARFRQFLGMKISFR